MKHRETQRKITAACFNDHLRLKSILEGRVEVLDRFAQKHSSEDEQIAEY